MGIKVVPTPLEFRAEMKKNFPEANVVMHLSFTTDRPVSDPILDVTFDGPVTVVPNSPAGNVFYENRMFSPRRSGFRFGFTWPPFGPNLDVQFTVYSSEAVHVVSADLISHVD